MNYTPGEINALEKNTRRELNRLLNLKSQTAANDRAYCLSILWLIEDLRDLRTAILERTER